MRIWQSCCWLWLCLAPLAAGRDIHVNNVTGDDHGDGRSAQSELTTSGPLHTISRALRVAQAGDHVVVANTLVPYRECVSLMGQRNSGSEIGPLVIDGNGAVLDGSGPVPADRWEYVAGDVFSFAPPRRGTQQLFTRGRLAIRRPAAADDVRLPALEPGEWCWWNARFHFRVDAGALPDNYELSCCYLQTGITLYYVHDVVIRNLVVQGFQTDGVNVADVVDAVLFEGVSARGNGRSGIAVRGASRVELDHCALEDNGETQLLNEGVAHTRVYASEILANTAPAVIARGGQVDLDVKALTEP